MEDIIRIAFASLRAQVAAQQAQIDALERLVMGSLPGPQPPVECAHEEKEDDGSTLGCLREKCVRCGKQFEQVIPE